MRLTFFGQSAWGLETRDGGRVLIDPYPVTPEARRLIETYAAGRLTHVLVTHAGFDHLGIALELLQQHQGTRLVADIAVARHALQSGVALPLIEVVGWNMEVAADGWRFRALEAKHASVIESVHGDYIAGMPLGFVLRHESEPEVGIYHLGDTSIFSDLALFGQLYGPMVAIIPVSGAMTAQEAALATLWLGVDIALPTHFMRDPEAAAQFCDAVSHLPRKIRSWVPEVGASHSVERTTRVSL